MSYHHLVKLERVIVFLTIIITNALITLKLLAAITISVN